MEHSQYRGETLYLWGTIIFSPHLTIPITGRELIQRLPRPTPGWFQLTQALLRQADQLEQVRDTLNPLRPGHQKQHGTIRALFGPQYSNLSQEVLTDKEVESLQLSRKIYAHIPTE